MNKRVAVILGNYKDYAEKYFPDCVDSIRKQDFNGEIKIFIYDNETSSETFNYLSKTIPEAELVLNTVNDGFAKGNNDAMKLALIQGFDYVFCLNTDIIIEENCIKNLVKILDDDKKVGAVQARLMLYPETDKVNSVGNTTHFLGFGYSQGYQEKWIGSRLQVNPSVKRICYPSGAAVMFSRKSLEDVGLFDEEFWMYNEDQDLGWRMWLAGFKCVLDPSAVVYHKYEFSRSITKYYWMDRNRIISIIKNYHILTLLLIFPTFLIMEIGLILFSLKSGWWKEKKQVWLYFLSVKNWIYLFRARRDTQRLRKVKDSAMISMFSGVIWYQEVDDWKLRLVNPFFNLYWKIVKFIIIW